MNRQIITDALLFITNSKRQGPPVRFWAMRNLPAVTLGYNQEVRFAEATREILKNPTIFNNFSVQEIEHELKLIISSARGLSVPQRQAHISSSVNSLFTSFGAQIEDYQFVIPISNLRICRSFKLGDVTFKNFTKYQTDKWAKIFRDTIRNNPHYNRIQKRKIVGKIRKYNLKPLMGYACAEIVCRAREKRAREIAIRKVNSALDIIKMYCMVERNQRNRNFGLKGEVLDLCTRSILQRSLSSGSLTPTLEKVGPLFPLEIDGKKLQIMRNQGVRILNKILRKTHRSWIEKKILRAIYWYSRIFDTPLRRIDDKKTLISRQTPSLKKSEILERGGTNERLVKAFVALESLFLLSPSEAIQNNIAERAAFILERSYLGRKAIKRFLKRMYKFRSEVIHHGFTYISRGELNQLISLVRAAIVTILLKKKKLGLNTQQDFYEYFEKKKFS